MKRLTAVLLTFLLCVSLITGCGSKDASAATVLNNGVIYTVEGDQWTDKPAQSIAIAENGSILATGSDGDLKSYIGKNTQVIDLNGKTVLPGLIDAHVHAPGTSLTELYNIYLYESMTKEKTLSDIKDYIAKNPDLKEYWGSGFNMGMASDGKGPQKEWLDEICVNKPIILESNDGHSYWLNSKALEMNGITKDTPNPQGGLIQKDPKTGELWGTLTDASSLITMKQTFNEKQEAEAFEHFQNKMNDWGYTGIMAIAPINVHSNVIKDFDVNHKLHLKMNLASEIKPDKDFSKELQKLKDLKKNMESNLIKVTTAKFFADGVVEGMTAYLLEPYAPEAGLAPDYRAEFYWDPEVLKQDFSQVMKAGFQIHVHSIGDASTRLVLDSLEYAQNQNPNIEARNVITHLQLIDNSDLPRFGKLGIIAATQPFWHLKEPDWYEPVDKTVLGEKRASNEYPLKSLKDHGAIITSSGDFPVSPINNPFWAIEAAVTRNLENPDYYGVADIKDMNDPTYLLNPKERLTVKDILEAYTINGAYQLYREDDIGSLKAGKSADLIVIDKDPLKINPLDLDRIKVEATLLNGKVVSGKL